jgi:flagellin
MSVINTNVKALVAQNSLNVNNRAMSKTMEQLSTGSRINGAKDDPAGLAISNKMTAQIRGLNQAVRNANDAVSMIQTAEGATKEITNMLQRMRELAVQAANDTNTAKDRVSLELEYNQLLDEIDRIAGNTEWNGMKLLAGSGASGIVGSAGTATFQVGANSGSAFQIQVNFLDMTVSGLGLSAAANLSAGSTSADAFETPSAAQAIITALDDAMVIVDGFRADLGAKINRLTYAADNLSNISMNTAESRSRILDTDYASATTELARAQIIQQAGTAMLAQANQQPASVLSLLQ